MSFRRIMGVSSYILSIAGVVLLTSIVDFALPDGSMNKYIKSIMGFFIIAVIIAPLPNLLSSNNTSFFETSGYEIQEDYLYKLNKTKIDVLQNEIEMSVSGEGYQNVKVMIELENNLSENMDIKSVSVDLTHLRITEKAGHKDISKIKEQIDEIITKKLNIKKEIVFYET